MICSFYGRHSRTDTGCNEDNYIVKGTTLVSNEQTNKNKNQVAVFNSVEVLLAIFIVNPASILHKSIAGLYRPVSVADGPIAASYRFM